jgi:hypothetical protein
VWFLRNDIIHGDGKCTVSGSEGFLLSYCESLGVAEATPTTRLSEKGKRKIGRLMHQERRADMLAQDKNGAVRWTAPPQGWVKINSNASFHEGTGAAECRSNH